MVLGEQCSQGSHFWWTNSAQPTSFQVPVLCRRDVLPDAREGTLVSAPDRDQRVDMPPERRCCPVFWPLRSIHLEAVFL